LRVLFERLTNASHISVPEDSETALNESALPSIPSGKLLLQIGHYRLCHR